MQTDDFLTNEEIRSLYLRGVAWSGRTVRGVSYLIIAYALTRINSYGLAGGGYLAVAIGLMGGGTSSARIAQAAIVILLLMAVLPLSVFASVKMAVG